MAGGVGLGKAAKGNDGEARCGAGERETERALGRMGGGETEGGQWEAAAAASARGGGVGDDGGGRRRSGTGGQSPNNQRSALGSGNPKRGGEERGTEDSSP